MEEYTEEQTAPVDVGDTSEESKSEDAIEEVTEDVVDDSYHRENEYDAIARRLDDVMEKLDAISDAVKGAFSVAVENGAVISDEDNATIEDVIEDVAADSIEDELNEMDFTL